MTEVIFYALKTIFGLGIFALIYRYLLFKEGNFFSRRFYLIFSVIISFILPLASFNFQFVQDSLRGNTSSLILNEITIYSNGLKSIETNSSIPYKTIFSWGYIMISGILGSRIVYQLVSILINIRRFNSSREKTLKIYRIPLKNTSYSFFKNIFIGETPGEDDLKKIMAHEKTHAIQWHTLDVLLMEMLSIAFWFNPLVWWYKTEIKNVHEYLADEGALQEGYNRKSYQITLLEHLIGSASLSITNNFNYSLIKNRIAMMNIEKNGRKNIWKIFLLLPISFVLMLAFACTEKSADNKLLNPDANSELSVETAFANVEIMPEYPGGFDALKKFVFENIEYPEGAKEKGVSGRVFLQFVVNKEGKIVKKLEQFKLEDDGEIIEDITVVGYKPSEGGSEGNTDIYVQELKDEAVRVLRLLPDFDTPAMKNGKPVAVVFTLPINFSLQ